MDALDWKKFYERAVLETNNELLAQKLTAAQQAVTARLQDLNRDHGGTPAEHEQLMTALKALETLRLERLER